MQYLNADSIQSWMLSVSITCPIRKTNISINRDGLDNAAFVSKIEQILTKEGWRYDEKGQLCCNS
jgi:hypothetical protein